MQPYPNPNYYAQYQPQYQNPYMQRMENLQQFQQALQQPQIPMQSQIAPMGKMVESVDMVKVADIPMDGNVYYFPKADGTEIYSKQFLQNGQTRILTFKPILDSETDNSTIENEKLKIDALNEVLSNIENDIKTLTDKVDKMAKPSKSKKEVSDDE